MVQCTAESECISAYKALLIAMSKALQAETHWLFQAPSGWGGQEPSCETDSCCMTVTSQKEELSSFVCSECKSVAQRNYLNLSHVRNTNKTFAWLLQLWGNMPEKRCNCLIESPPESLQKMAKSIYKIGFCTISLIPMDIFLNCLEPPYKVMIHPKKIFHKFMHN